MAFAVTEWILLIASGIIYFVFLLYDLFKRGDDYGKYAYILAVIPANYLWYILTKNEMYDFGALGAMMVLGGCWLLAAIRDIIIKDKSKEYKDADDVLLMLIIAIVINLILIAVIPSFPNNAFMRNGTMVAPILGFFYFPEFRLEMLTPASGFNPDYVPGDAILIVYKIIVTALVLLVIFPLVVDLKGEKTAVWIIAIISILFAIPFWFIAFIWASSSGLIWVLTVLFTVLFFTLLLMITRGESDKTNVSKILGGS